MGMNMDQYTPEFTAKGVDGLQLLHLDSDKLKVKKEKEKHSGLQSYQIPIHLNNYHNWLFYYLCCDEAVRIVIV